MSSRSSPWCYLIPFLRVWFGMHLLYSGLAYVVGGYVPTEMARSESAAGSMMTMMANVGLYQPTKYLEVITGLLLIFDMATPLALVLEMPVTVMVSFMNLAVATAARHKFTGVQELALNGTLLFAYGGYYVQFLRVRAAPCLLWEAPPDSGAARPAALTNVGVTWLTIILLLAVVALASWFTGTVERRLPPRDYVPPLAGALLAAVLMWRERRNPGGSAHA